MKEIVVLDESSKTIQWWSEYQTRFFLNESVFKMGM